MKGHAMKLSIDKEGDLFIYFAGSWRCNKNYKLPCNIKCNEFQICERQRKKWKSNDLETRIEIKTCCHLFDFLKEECNDERNLNFKKELS